MATDLTAGLPPDAVTKAATVHAGWHGRKPQGGDRSCAEVMLAAAAPAIRAQERAEWQARMADIRRTAEDWASKAPADDWGDGGIAETIAADLGRGILHMLDEPLLDDPVAAAVRAERQRIRPLVAQWRKSADSLASSNPAWSSHFYDCALELNRLIGEQ